MSNFDQIARSILMRVVTIENGDEGITIHKEAREKLSIKDGDFVDFLLTRDGSVKIIKFEFVGTRQ
ncbi:MAG TPA: AbrB/MazE/SpoVT family DNA-binding domain-containing protein [Nitrososphaeraceae archaeon]|nr:AbrB/MazE/SpoVT family DNA-binding domain-containing protein [Nitrososphaeraceae archaeon]